MDRAAAPEAFDLIEPETIAAMLCRMIVTTSIGDGGVRASTHVLYPSNGAVTVTIRGGTDTFIVSDDGAALGELISSGLKSEISDRQIFAKVKTQGLRVQDGTISSPRVPTEAVPAAVMLVANASAEVARWALDHFSFEEKRNFRKDLENILGRYFHDNLKHNTPIIGASNKPHKFNYVVYLQKDRRLLVDPVTNDHNSIVSRVVANLDVSNAHDPYIDQLIVYDDHLKWSASDLKLLELGAQTVPFSQAEPEIRRHAA
jgi:hypothetical protein